MSIQRALAHELREDIATVGMLHDTSRLNYWSEDDVFNLIVESVQTEKPYNTFQHWVQQHHKNVKANDDMWEGGVEWFRKTDDYKAMDSRLSRKIDDRFNSAEWSRVPIEAGSKKAPTMLRDNGDRVQYLPVDQKLESFRRAEQWLEEHCK